MGLEFNADEMIAAVDKRDEDVMNAAIEHISVKQYKQDRWLNERKGWLHFCQPKSYSKLRMFLLRGPKFKCHNCSSRDLEFIGSWYNPKFSQVSQITYGDHSLWRCKSCGCLRNGDDVTKD